MSSASREDLIRRRDQIAERHGAWVGHNIHLGHGVHTMSDRLVGAETTARHLLHLVATTARKPLAELTVLDLGCSEGLFAIEFALQGATVLGIEGRPDPLARADFAREALGLDRLRFVQDDVLKVTEERYGRFDVILNCGLLYHLDVPGVFHVLGQMGRMCRDLAIVETHYALTPTERYTHDGFAYYGQSWREHEDTSDPDLRRRREWASLENTHSFWLAKPSLVNALVNAGFATVTESLYPSLLGFRDRETFLARKGEAPGPRAVDFAEATAPRLLPIENRRMLNAWQGQTQIANPATEPFYADATTRDLDMLRRRADAADRRMHAIEREAAATTALVKDLRRELNERLEAVDQRFQGVAWNFENLTRILDHATRALGEAASSIQHIRWQLRRPWFMRRREPGD